MDEAQIRSMIADHFAWSGKDEVRASACYTDDAVLEFPQGGERIRVVRGPDPRDRERPAVAPPELLGTHLPAARMAIGVGEVEGR